MDKRRGFTLIEQLAVLTIVATLVALVVGVVRYTHHVANEATVQTDLALLSDALQNYFIEEGAYPDVASYHSDSASVGSTPGGQLVDPWGSPYAYTSAPASFAVWSVGPDGEDNTGDELRPGQ